MKKPRIMEFTDPETIANFLKAGIGQHDGYVGVFTRVTAPGAIPSNTRIAKVWCEDGDTTPLGTRGTVLGSVRHPDLGLMYFIEWDGRAGIAIAAVAKKIGVVS